jgi:hypothetical protein
VTPLSRSRARLTLVACTNRKLRTLSKLPNRQFPRWAGIAFSVLALVCVALLVLTVQIVTSGPTDPAGPPPPLPTDSTSADTALNCQEQAEFTEATYDVSGSSQEGASVVQFYLGGYVDQTFTAQLPCLIEVAVVTALDPNLGQPTTLRECGPNGSIGKVLYQIKEGETVLDDQERPACQNVPTRWTLESPLLLTVGNTYTLRVTNLESNRLSIYFNGNGSAKGSTLHNAVNPEGSGVQYDKAVAGTILGRPA